MIVKDFITKDKEELIIYNSGLKKLLFSSFLLLPLGVFFVILANKFYNINLHITLLSIIVLLIVYIYRYSFKQDILLVLNKNGIWYKNDSYQWNEIHAVKSYKVLMVNYISFNTIKENKKIELSLFLTIGSTISIMETAQFFIKTHHLDPNKDAEMPFVPLIQSLYEGMEEGFAPMIIYIVSIVSSIAIQFLIISLLGRTVFSVFNLFHISEAKDKVELYKPTIDSILQKLNGNTVIVFDSITYQNYYFKVNRSIGQNGDIIEKSSFINAYPLVTKGIIEHLELGFPLVKYPKLIIDFNNCIIPINRYITNIPNEASTNKVLFWNDNTNLQFLRDLYSSDYYLQAYIHLKKEFDSCKADFDNISARCKIVSQDSGKDTLLQYCKKGIEYLVKEDVSGEYRTNNMGYSGDEKIYLNLCPTTIIGNHKSKLSVYLNRFTLFGYVTIPLQNDTINSVNMEIESFVFGTSNNLIGYNPLIFYPECKRLPFIKMMNEYEKSSLHDPIKNNFHLFFLRKNSNQIIINKIKSLYNNDSEFDKYYKFCIKLNEYFDQNYLYEYRDF